MPRPATRRATRRRSDHGATDASGPAGEATECGVVLGDGWLDGVDLPGPGLARQTGALHLPGGKHDARGAVLRTAAIAAVLDAAGLGPGAPGDRTFRRRVDRVQLQPAAYRYRSIVSGCSRRPTRRRAGALSARHRLRRCRGVR